MERERKRESESERERERERERKREIKTNNMEQILKWDLQQNGRQWRAMVFHMREEDGNRNSDHGSEWIWNTVCHQTKSTKQYSSLPSRPHTHFTCLSNIHLIISGYVYFSIFSAALCDNNRYTPGMWLRGGWCSSLLACATLFANTSQLLREWLWLCGHHGNMTA